MVEAAERTGKLLTIGYQNRYRVDTLTLKDMAVNGELGDIYMAKAHALRRRGIPTWGVFTNKFEQDVYKRQILIRDCNCKIVDSVALNIGNYRDQLTLMLSGNEHLDTFVAHYANFASYVAKGQIIELDELLNEYGQGIIDTLGEQNLNAGKVSGKPVSYTHLDVYKRQALFQGRR